MAPALGMAGHAVLLALATSAPLCSALLRGRGRDPLGADFFHGAAEAESTRSEDAAIAAKGGVTDGWEVHPSDPSKGEPHFAAWFHESDSGGPEHAWQTHFPALKRGLAGQGVETGDWHLSGGGEWVQDYRPGSPRGAQTADASDKHAAWFESGINQYDGFGRAKAPYPGSGKALVEADLWQERSVNGTMTCAEAGCTANATLQAFDGETELASHCKFSFNLHPTDFDDQYSGERLNFISVNGATVNTDCFPMVSGCNASTQRPLFSCLQDLSLDSIIDASGRLTVSAQISDVVDECPYEGNLLSAVPMVTCLVQPKPTPGPTSQPVYPPLPTARTVPPPPPRPTRLYHSAPLKCAYRGCTAHAEMHFNTTEIGYELSQCLMTVRINQTDFDNDDGTLEQIEFLRVGNSTVASNVSTGVNPCRSAWRGTPLSQEEIVHVLLDGHDVTSNASAGLVAVSAKITPHVDECAQNGYLLDGFIDVNCTLGASLAERGNAMEAVNATGASNSTVVVNTTDASTGASNSTVVANTTDARSNETEAAAATAAAAPAANASSSGNGTDASAPPDPQIGRAHV